MPVRGRSIRVDDSSMSPYLSQGDQLWVEEEESGPPRLGQLVLAQAPRTGKLMIRRFFPGGRLVADQPDVPDPHQGDDYRIVGVITGRVVSGTNRWIAYSAPRITQLHRVQALLAWAAQGERPIHRMAKRTLGVVGKLLRRIEERL